VISEADLRGTEPGMGIFPYQKFIIYPVSIILGCVAAQVMQIYRDCTLPVIIDAVCQDTDSFKIIAGRNFRLHEYYKSSSIDRYTNNPCPADQLHVVGKDNIHLWNSF
jgi:hypothetical protein